MNNKHSFAFLVCALLLMLAACGPAPTPPAATHPAPQASTTILLCCGPAQYSKLAALASANGIKLLVSANPLEFEAQMTDTTLNAGAAIYAPYGYSDAPKDSGLFGMQKLLQKGGRVFVFYTDQWADANPRVLEIFGISITREVVVTTSWVNTDAYYYDPAMLPAWLTGLKIATTSHDLSPAYTDLGIGAYLDVTGSDGGRASTLSHTSGQNRLVYYNNPDKSITFFPDPALSNGVDVQYQPFIHNDQMDYGDNAKAALALLKYLLSK